MPPTTRPIVSTLGVLAALALAPAVSAQLAADWMVPAAAHNPGVGGTFWRTDLSLHNPHQYELPVIVQVLPSDTENFEVASLDLTLHPWETVNLWDVLGPGVFDFEGSAAMLAYADPSLSCDPIESCHFLATSRTYTPDGSGGGEYGLTVAGVGVGRATDWSSFGYAAGILNDGEFFRCNIGVASWTPEWTTVRVDVQSADGQVLSSEIFEIPPFGHSQRRLATAVEGGSLVFYLEAGPDDAAVFPYATVINQATGDASFFFAEASAVGVSASKGRDAAGRPPVPRDGQTVAPSR
ncbi:MAG TPA: hypothetical protein VLT81_15015 [Chondromyces sp.]|nr:hypothetical protein [Chondromyces sp.]